MNKYKRLGKNTFLVFAGNIGSKLISLLMLPFFTKWLSVGDYGVTDLIGVYVSFLLVIVSACIYEAIFIFPKGQEFNKQKSYLSTGMFFALLSLLVTVIVFYAINIIFNIIDYSSIFTKYNWFIFGLISSTFLQTFIQQFSRSINKILVYAVTGLVLTVTFALLSLYLVPKYGVEGFLYSQIISIVFAAAYNFFFAKVYLFFSFKSIKLSVLREMLKYSIPLIPNGIMWWLVGALNRPIMEYYLGNGPIGIFAVANKIPSILSMIFTVFVYAWQISIIEEFGKEGFQIFYNKVLKILFGVLVFLSCTIAVLSEFIISLMADEKFFDAWRYVPILSIAVLFSSLSGFVGANFSASKESKYFFYSSIWGAITSILLNFILIPKYGLLGASFSVVMSHFIMASARIKYSWKYVKITSIYYYLSLLLINTIIVFIIYFTDSSLLKYSLVTMLLLLFVYMNKGNIVDFKSNYFVILNRLKNKVK